VCGISNGVGGQAGGDELGREDIRLNQANPHINSNILVKGNTIANETASCPLLGNGPFGYAAWDAIHVDGGDSNGLYTQNIIHDLAAWTGVTDTTGILMEAGTQGNVISNNLIYNITKPGNVGARGIFIGAVAPGTQQYVFGNTVYGVDYEGINVYQNGTVENNILLNNATQIACYITPCTNIVSDYNCFWDNSGGSNVGHFNNSVVNFATWKSDTGLDAHSLNSNPNLLNPSAGTVAGFKETASSPTLGAGITISGMTNDLLGVPRTAHYDIGALQGDR
jgi:hypothetical protein